MKKANSTYICDPEESIIVVSFPLPSVTNYSLLLSLVVILSNVYKCTIVICGGLVQNLVNNIDLIKLIKNKQVFILDIGLRMSHKPSSRKLSLRGIILYFKIQIKLISALIKLHRHAKVVMAFIGLSHMIPTLLLVKLFRKKLVVY